MIDAEEMRWAAILENFRSIYAAMKKQQEDRTWNWFSKGRVITMRGLTQNEAMDLFVKKGGMVLSDECIEMTRPELRAERNDG